MDATVTEPGQPTLSAACRRAFDDRGTSYYALPALAEHGFARIGRLPIVLRIVLESLLRHAGQGQVSDDDVAALADWQPRAERDREIPFVVGRIVLQDVAGIPLLGDLAAMRDAIAERGADPAVVRPRVPVDMVIDHSISVEHHATPDAAVRNMAVEFATNEERFAFVKWAVSSIDGIRLITPGSGILHQVNLEHLAPGLLRDGDVVYPDTLVGTDSHTVMIAGLGVVGWGVGGIEAESAMLGQPVGILTPDVVAVELSGALRAGVTATDLVLHLTHRLREERVVGKFLEFVGDGTASLTVPDRATVANMAPEYGATIGFFPHDRQTSRYLLDTGRSPDVVDALERYLRLQGLDAAPTVDTIDYSAVIAVDLADVQPIVAGPKRPQDVTPLPDVPAMFARTLAAPRERGGYGRAAAAAGASSADALADGDIVIAAITSCTNTSNPDSMLLAGLVARSAVERGLKVAPHVKTSLAPGSLVVSRYLDATGLTRALDALGFAVVGYGCTTCVGNSGPLLPGLEDAIRRDGVVAAAVLSGNRNFEGRIHPAVDAAFLMSPPLVVAYALAGRITVDLANEPLGVDRDGAPVTLADLWPSDDELASMRRTANDAALYRDVYATLATDRPPEWDAIASNEGQRFQWADRSTYIRRPPYFSDPALAASSLVDVRDARPLAVLGDSVTTDHISPIGTIARDSPAARYLQASGVGPADFSSYGARRMNADVMTRGTFANRLLANRIAGGRAGGYTTHWPSGDVVSIHEAATRYADERVPVVVFAGRDYGMGSARDWAAKGTRLLGVRAVVAESFERIHRSNLAGMGVLPCELPDGVRVETLGLDGRERVDIVGVAGAGPRGRLRLVIRRDDGTTVEHPLTLRLDTPVEIEYAKRGGILPYVVDQVIAA